MMVKADELRLSSAGWVEQAVRAKKNHWSFIIWHFSVVISFGSQ
jgi:hypothetical protein